MKKITVKKLIEFRNKSDRSKITFVKNLKTTKEVKVDKSSGDYWISCLSAIRNAFKNRDLGLLDEKINFLNGKINITEDLRLKGQYQRNADILTNFKDYDFLNLRPKTELSFKAQPKLNSIIEINGLPVEAKPCHIYTFSIKNSEEIGGIWFIAQLKGFKKNELGMFTDVLYRYLEKNYSKDFFVNPDYCVAVDLFNCQEVKYSEIIKSKLPKLLDTTIEEIKKL